MYANLDNSIMSKLDEIKTEAGTNKPDILLFTEIKPKNGQPPEVSSLNIPGYTVYTNDLNENGTRGVCIYVNSQIKSSDVKINGHEFKDCVSVKISASKKYTTLLQCIYRSGTVETAKGNDEEMYKLIKNTCSLNGYNQMLICGDFNLNKISWDPDPSNPTLPPSSSPDSPESKFLECFNDCFLTQHVTEPTRYRKGIRDERPTLDDLIITKSENDVGVISYNPSIVLSDHITLNFNLNWSSIPKPVKRTIFLYDKGDYEKMQNMFNSIDWNTELAGKSVEEALQTFEIFYNQAVHECIPTKQVGSESRFKPLWMSNNALRKVKRKHSSWVRYLNTKQGQDFLEYKNRRNEANHAIKAARKEFEKSLAKNCRKNPKGVWHYIKSQRKTKTLIPNLVKSDGSFTTTDEEITEVLNEQFFSVFTREDVANKPKIPPKKLITDELISINIQREEVEKLLKKR